MAGHREPPAPNRFNPSVNEPQHAPIDAQTRQHYQDVRHANERLREVNTGQKTKTSAPIPTLRDRWDDLNLPPLPWTPKKETTTKSSSPEALCEALKHGAIDNPAIGDERCALPQKPKPPRTR